MGLKAGALSQITMGEAELSQFKLLIGSAEEVLQKPFLNVMKKSQSKIRESVVAIVVDESRTL